MQTRGIAAAATIIIWSLFVMPGNGSLAAESVKVGFTLPLSGAAAPGGKQVLAALQLWRDDINAKGGVLGKPVELVYYDDQGTAARVPPLYRKLLSVDKVALIIGPYASNTASAAMRVIMEFNRATISILAFGVNRIFSYRRYFAMAPAGLEGVKAFSKGFFDLAAEQKPKPQTVALLAANTEFDRTATDGARENARTEGFSVVYDVTYSANNTDFTSTARDIQAAKADIVFVSARQADVQRIVRAANDVGLTPKMFGGILPELQAASIKVQLGPLLDGIITTENYVPASTLDFPGAADLLKRYRAAAAPEQLDRSGYEIVPFAYAAGQVLAQAVEATKSVDSDKLADYMHTNRFDTVVGPIEYDRDGEWSKPRILLTQFRHVLANDAAQFADNRVLPIVWPPQYKTGDLIYPYGDANR